MTVSGMQAMPDPFSLTQDLDRPMPCCAKLRSNSMHYSPDERPGKLRMSEETVYTCNKTYEPQGPDGGIANPRECQNGRVCFVEP